MNVRSYVAPIVLALILLPFTFTGSPQLRAADDSQASQTKELPTLLSKWQEAISVGDASLIGGYLNRDFFAVGPAGQLEDKRAFVERFTSKDLNVTKVEGDDQSVRMHGEGAIVTGVYTLEGKSGDRDISGKYRYVDTWMKTDDEWRLLASTLTRVEE